MGINKNRDNSFYFYATIIAIFFLFILFSGCLDITIDSKINGDGEITNYKVTMEMASSTYQLIANSAKSQGYSSVKDIFINSKSQDSWGLDSTNIDYLEDWPRGENKVKITLKNINPFIPNPKSGIKISHTGNELIFNYNPSGSGTSNQSSLISGYTSAILVNYYLEMPGKIIDSDANTINGNIAEWHTNLGEIGTSGIYARSTIDLIPDLIPDWVLQIIFLILILIAGVFLARFFGPKKAFLIFLFLVMLCLLGAFLGYISLPYGLGINPATTIFASSEDWTLKGDMYYNGEQFGDAIMYYDRAVAKNPNSIRTWYYRGIALSVLGRYDEAVESFDKALKINPENSNAWFNRGIALAKLGRNDEAIASYDKVLEINPEYSDAWFNRGIALYVLGRNDEAIASYDKALKIDPNYEMARQNREIALKNPNVKPTLPPQFVWAE